jgi:uncharacterized membrane protein
VAALQLGLCLAGPALIYLALRVASARQVAAAALLLLLLRVAVAARREFRGQVRAFGLPLLAVAGAGVVSLIWNDPLALLATPSLVSFGLLFAFAGSLRGESVVERLARAQKASLCDEEVLYCRRVTVVWCAFFLGNGALALWLAVAATRAEWALYTGLVSYLLIGTLYASEFVYRHWRFRHTLGAPSEALFRRIFPPRLG